jgi:hypothetical protein
MNFLDGIPKTSKLLGRHQPKTPPLAKIRPGHSPTMSTGAPRAAPAIGASFCLTPSEILALASQPNGVCATRWEGALGASQKAAPHIVSPLVPRALAPGL